MGDHKGPWMLLKTLLNFVLSMRLIIGVLHLLGVISMKAKKSLRRGLIGWRLLRNDIPFFP